jgi:hypothetical protein
MSFLIPSEFISTPHADAMVCVVTSAAEARASLIGGENP